MGGYREAARRETPAPELIRYGPFPRDWRPLAGIPVVLFFVAVFVVVSGPTVDLECTDGECVVETGFVWFIASQATAFNANGASVETSRNRNGARVRLYRSDGPPIEFELRTFLVDSDIESLEAYLASPSGELSIGSMPSLVLWFMLGMGVFLITMFSRDAFACASIIELRVHPDAIELVDRWPGYRRQRRLDLDQPTEVRVLEQDVRTFGRGDLEGAIVQIVDAGDRVRPLTPRTYPLPDVHQRVAAELRAVLGLGLEPDEDDDDDWDDDDSDWHDDDGGDDWNDDT